MHMARWGSWRAVLGVLLAATALVFQAQLLVDARTLQEAGFGDTSDFSMSDSMPDGAGGGSSGLVGGGDSLPMDTSTGGETGTEDPFGDGGTDEPFGGGDTQGTGEPFGDGGTEEPLGGMQSGGMANGFDGTDGGTSSEPPPPPLPPPPPPSPDSDSADASPPPPPPSPPGPDEASGGGTDDQETFADETTGDDMTSSDGGMPCEDLTTCEPTDLNGPDYEDVKAVVEEIDSPEQAEDYAESYGRACEEQGCYDSRSYAVAIVDVDINFYTIVEGECYAVANSRLEPSYAAQAGCYAIQWCKLYPERYRTYYASYSYSVTYSYFCVAESHGRVYASGYEYAAASATVLANMYYEYTSYSITVTEVSYVCAQSLFVAINEGVGCYDIVRILAVMWEIAVAAGSDYDLITAIAEISSVTQCLYTSEAQGYFSSEVSSGYLIYEHLNAYSGGGGLASSGGFGFPG